MRGLVHRRHWPVAPVGRKYGDHHRGVGERHQRLTADNTAVPAQAFGKGHAQNRTRLPVSGGSSRPGIIQFANRESEILYPGREHVGKDATGFIDIELGLLLTALHEPSSPTIGGTALCVAGERAPKGGARPRLLISEINNRYCSPSFETATSRPLRMKSNSLKHNDLMLRSEHRERLQAWAKRDSAISKVSFRGPFA